MAPKPNQIYQHFKGGLYKIITTAMHTETEERLVIYQALYGDYKVYARPLSMFLEEVDHKKYPDVAQKYRFQPVEQMVDAVLDERERDTLWSEMAQNLTQIEENLDIQRKQGLERLMSFRMEESLEAPFEEGKEERDSFAEEERSLDPMLEAYLDADSCRERLNILHGIHHRITEDMLLTMAVVIDFELPEGDLEEKYIALQDCLLTKEKYECGRIL